MTPQEYIDLESEFGAHNYHPLPVVLERGEGVHVYDVAGKKYLDFFICLQRSESRALPSPFSQSHFRTGV